MSVQERLAGCNRSDIVYTFSLVNLFNINNSIGLKCSQLDRNFKQKLKVSGDREKIENQFF